MNSTDLKFFMAVADTGAIGRAASVLNTVQSNVTNRIRALELALNVPLFYRGSRGVTLTKAGERLLPYARQVTRLLADAEQSVRCEGAPRGPLRIGSLETTAALRLPALLTSFADLHPDVDIELETGSTEFLIKHVVERKLEGAFVSGPITHEDLATIPVLEEELVLVGSARVPNCADLLATLSTNRGARVLVFRTGCSYRSRLEMFLAAQGLVQARRMEFGTLDGILACVEAGMGVTMIPRVVAEPLHKAGRVSMHRMPGDVGRAQTLLTYRTDSILTAAFEAFVSHTELILQETGCGDSLPPKTHATLGRAVQDAL